MGRWDDYDKTEDDEDLNTPVALAIRQMVGGTVEEARQTLADNPALLVEVATAMGVPPALLKLQLKAIYRKEGSSDYVGQVMDNVDLARKTAMETTERNILAQSTDMRRALAISRMEFCYGQLAAAGMQTGDWKAWKAAANVAMDVARVDGTLQEKATVETALGKAASVIKERRKNVLTVQKGAVIEGAIVGGELGVEHGTGEGQLDELGGAVAVGEVEW